MRFTINPITSQFDVVNLSGGTGGELISLTGNSGGAVTGDSGGNVNVVGDNTTGINTVGNLVANTLTLQGIASTTTQVGTTAYSTNVQAAAQSSTTTALTPSNITSLFSTNYLPATQGGTGLSSPTAHSLLVAEGASAFTALGVATNGQLPIGSTGADPVLGNLTSSNSSITVTNGAGTISLTAGAALATSYTCDTGSAVPAANVLTVHGGIGCATSGAASTVTVDLDATVPLSFTCNSGTATPAANALSVLGSGSVTTSGSGSTITITTSGGFTWTDITGATQTLAVANGYVTNRAGGVTYTLPSTATEGDIIEVAGKSGAWIIAQNANQQINVGSASSTVGVGGSVASSNAGDCIRLLCTTSGSSTVWRALSFVGNLTVT